MPGDGNSNEKTQYDMLEGLEEQDSAPKAPEPNPTPEEKKDIFQKTEQNTGFYDVYEKINNDAGINTNKKTIDTLFLTISTTPNIDQEFFKQNGYELVSTMLKNDPELKTISPENIIDTIRYNQKIESNSEQAETKADQAETKADQAETKADQAETKAEETTNNTTTKEEKEATETMILSNLGIIKDKYNTLTATKQYVESFFTNPNSLSPKTKTWFTQRSEFFDNEIIAKNTSLQTLSKEDQLQLKKFWLANERVKEFGQTNKYADQKALLESFTTFETNLGYSIGYKENLTSKTWDQPIYNESKSAPIYNENPEATKPEIKSLLNNPNQVLEDKSGVESFLPKESTIGMYDDTKVFENVDTNKLLALDPKGTRELLETNLKNNKLGDYAKDFDDLGNYKGDTTLSEETEQQLLNISKITQEESKKRIMEQCSKALEAKAQENIVTGSIGAITKMFDIQIGSGTSSKSLMDQFKTDNWKFENQSFHFEGSVNDKLWMGTTYDFKNGKVSINDPFYWNEQDKEFSVGRNNNKGNDVGLMLPTQKEIMQKVKNIPLDEVLNKGEYATMDEYITRLGNEQKTQIDKSFAYVPANKAYTQMWAERNLAMQETFNMINGKLATISGGQEKDFLKWKEGEAMIINENTNPQIYEILKILDQTTNQMNTQDIRILRRNIQSTWLLMESSKMKKGEGEEALGKLFSKESLKKTAGTRGTEKGAFGILFNLITNPKTSPKMIDNTVYTTIIDCLNHNRKLTDEQYITKLPNRFKTKYEKYLNESEIAAAEGKIEKVYDTTI